MSDQLQTTEATTETAAHGVLLTDVAASKVASLLAQEGRDDLRLRVGVQPGGCSGLIYQLYFDERTLDGDLVRDFDGVEVVVDRMSGDVTTGPKIGGKKNMAAFAWFTNKVDAQIKRALDAEDGLNKVKYQVDVRVFLTAQGDIDHAELIDSSGDVQIDALIRKVLSNIPPLKESAPEDMPRKVIVRMASKNMS